MADPLLTKILVPLDGSANSEAVLSHLRRILPRHDARILLLYATSFASWPGDQDPDAYLRRLSFQLTNDGYPATPLIRMGVASDAIIAAAREEGASMIALTTHGRTGAARWIMGSVAERVLQLSPLPVLVSHTFPATQSRGQLESRPVRNFLVALDGSRMSLGVLAPVLNLARPVDAHVTLLHVTPPSPYDGRWEPPDQTLQEADQVFRKACIPARIEHRKGDPGEEILRAAKDLDSDVIAMTTHGRSGPSRWVFGSVTSTVLRTASIPLLVVRQPVPKEKTIPLAENPTDSIPAPGGPSAGTGLAQPRT